MPPLQSVMDTGGGEWGKESPPPNSAKIVTGEGGGPRRKKHIGPGVRMFGKNVKTGR